MRFKTLQAGSIGLLALAAVGCASSQGSTAGGSESAASQAAVGELGPALIQWTGRFKSQIQHDPHVLAPTRNEASGSAVLTAASPTQMRAKIDLRLPQFTDPVRLYWSISSGPCGSNSLPLLTVSQFPQISISSGMGSLDVVLPVAIPTSGDYHVNVFDANSDGSDESGVITCAALALQRRTSGN